MNATLVKLVYDVDIQGDILERFDEILTAEAISFIKILHQKFEGARQELLEQRQETQRHIEAGLPLTFPKETKSIRTTDWKISPIPAYLEDRRVEITGPVDRKMVINALNSNAKVFMADFEDSHAPTWAGTIQGQINLLDANKGTISYQNPSSGKRYKLNDNPAILFVRPRGWHLNEKHVIIAGEPVSGSLFDFGLYFFHNAALLLQSGKVPTFYLPKLEHYKEARLWNAVFTFAQEYLNIPTGTIKATVLIETITASFQLDEILYELREHAAGLNCGRWDYIFSFIKRFRNDPNYILPDRSAVTMQVPFMAAYAKRVVQVCHTRGAHAIGGMAAQIPIKGDEKANVAAFEKVRADKLREVQLGHDGTWVAHPGLVAVAMNVFDEHMPTANQISKTLPEGIITESDLITPPKGPVTEEGVRMNIQVGLLYVSAWLSGTGAAAIHHLMEDAATAEISRTQLWQWLRFAVKLENGRTLTPKLYKVYRTEEVLKIEQQEGHPTTWIAQLPRAITLFDNLVLKTEFTDFLTLEAYDFF
jgi:malate synthase